MHKQLLRVTFYAFLQLDASYRTCLKNTVHTKLLPIRLQISIQFCLTFPQQVASGRATSPWQHAASVLRHLARERGSAAEWTHDRARSEQHQKQDGGVAGGCSQRPAAVSEKQWDDREAGGLGANRPPSGAFWPAALYTCDVIGV